jgi:CheY-like chemotaxis protein/HPt (histidine-containing phosphotransfer) domain-containing protein
LRQVLLNLLGNALKFTDEGEIVTTVRILEEHENDLSLKFSVADTGIGIPEGKLEHVFEVFSQADASITKRFGGTGLGLAICRRLINLMGGEIEVRSKVGKGSVFHFQIPMMKAPENTMAVQVPKKSEMASGADFPEKASESAFRRLLILLAEDDAPVQKMTSLLLEKKMGHRVDIAHNGNQTVEMALAKPYDIILMDVNMPLLDGLAATRKIRAAGCEIPIVALTANIMNGVQKRFLEVGMDGYLSKPISAKRLTDAFQRFCGAGIEEKNERAEPDFEESQRGSDTEFVETTEDLAQSVSLSHEDYKEILAEFIALREMDIQKLTETFREGDTDSVCQLAHKIKSSAKMLALDAIADSASKIEKAVLNEDLPETEIGLDSLKVAFRTLQERN